MTTGNDICAEAWAAFEAWCHEHDTEDLSVLDAISAYSKWCDEQSALKTAQREEP